MTAQPFQQLAVRTLEAQSQNIASGTIGSCRQSQQDLKDYGATVGEPADLVMLDAPDPVKALRTVAPVLAAFKRGRRP
jgi:tRNA A58 N-methylase Trm61